MINPYKRPEGPPFSNPWLKRASTVSQVINSQTAKPKRDQKSKRRLRTCFLPRRARMASSADRSMGPVILITKPGDNFTARKYVSSYLRGSKIAALGDLVKEEPGSDFACRKRMCRVNDLN